jgi:antitoxin component YwqK of YwqJK toxin-antitoxin module
MANQNIHYFGCMKFLYPVLLLMLSISSYAQKAEKFYDYHWHEADPAQSLFYSIGEQTDSGWHRRDYYIHASSLQMDGYFTDSTCKTRSGPFFYYYANKRLENKGRYLNGKKEGLWKSFYSNGMMQDSTVYAGGKPIGISLGWYRSGLPADSANWNADGSGLKVEWFENGNPASGGRYAGGFKQQGKWQYFHDNGKISAIEVYDRGVLKSKNYFDEQGGPIADTTDKSKAAVFPGGQAAWVKFISNEIYFPPGYKIVNGDQVIVEVTAIIDEQGNVKDVETSLPFRPDFDKIALDGIKKSPKWIPAQNHNRKVSQGVRQPVVFSNAPD